MTIDVIRDAWNEVTAKCMNGVWKKLWPDTVSLPKDEVDSDIIGATREIANTALGFSDIDEENVCKLLNSCTEDLSIDDLMLISKDNLQETEVRNFNPQEKRR